MFWRGLTWDQTFSHSKLHMQNGYLFRYLLLAEVLEVGVVDVDEGVLEVSGVSGTRLNGFLMKN